MDSGKGNMGQELSDFKTILHLTTQKLKVISSLFELDINASQACCTKDFTVYKRLGDVFGFLV